MFCGTYQFFSHKYYIFILYEVPFLVYEACQSEGNLPYSTQEKPNKSIHCTKRTCSLIDKPANTLHLLFFENSSVYSESLVLKCQYSMLSVTTAWRILRLRMEEMASYSFFTLALNWGNWSVSYPSCALPTEKDPQYPLDRRLGEPQS
jgi:hypothetical protein